MYCSCDNCDHDGNSVAFNRVIPQISAGRAPKEHNRRPVSSTRLIRPMALQFSAPKSFLEPSFWEEVCDRKLNEWKLSQDPVNIKVQLVPSDGSVQGSFLFNKDSIMEEMKGAVVVQGQLLLVNSLEEFKEFDKLSFIQHKGLELLSRMQSCASMRAADLVAPIVLAYADLKHYHHTYWMCLPALAPRFSLFTQSPTDQIPAELLDVAYRQLRVSRELAFVTALDPATSALQAHSFHEGWPLLFNSTPAQLVFLDQGVGQVTGWPLRNLLLYLFVRARLSGLDLKTQISVLMLRNPQFRSWHAVPELEGAVAQDASAMTSISFLSAPYLGRLEVSETMQELLTDAQVVGWEANERGNPGPRQVKSGGPSGGDATSLMRQAGDLNIKLMKWRLWPDLQVDRIQQTRCLLLGAGTLGCSVARTLLGYGVRRITFVDNGRVSYSNPARQCLYTQEDAIARDYKAVTAARRLREINANVEAVGEVLAIPMPGHPFATAPVTGELAEGPVLCDAAALRRLDELVRNHDCVFVVTDSREARWLPALLCRAHEKLCINVALGFDSLLSMHHCAPFGCYFCNDLTSAGNSHKRRAMDEQCTITRPGLAPMASGLAVEQMVQIVQHLASCGRELSEGVFLEDDAPVPHQIRASLAGFSQTTMRTPAFAHCTACSPAVVEAFHADSEGLIQKVCAHPDMLEELSGARELMDAVDMEACMWSEDEDDA